VLLGYLRMSYPQIAFGAFSASCMRINATAL